jgi:hypothetical protein
VINSNDSPEEDRPGTPASSHGVGNIASSPEAAASRRGFIKSGLAAGSIVLSVVNRPAWAEETEDATRSDMASSTHLSHAPREA